MVLFERISFSVWARKIARGRAMGLAQELESGFERGRILFLKKVRSPN
uniref:Uncharacterized protein n=1 Tax=Utricularia reniformis TaxID=192314 RepID=A0A1Y0AYN7_9LAMI|nr:hypothetical protein AEK19_MT0249 [Utricularia reniformis]ART30269.1 hypothetical protein AEK19_MT0249 [Utricularia reniformis]